MVSIYRFKKKNKRKWKWKPYHYLIDDQSPRNLFRSSTSTFLSNRYLFGRWRWFGEWQPNRNSNHVFTQENFKEMRARTFSFSPFFLFFWYLNNPNLECSVPKLLKCIVMQIFHFLYIFLCNRIFFASWAIKK